MKRWFRRAIGLCVIFTGLILVAERAEAEHPQYLILTPMNYGYGQPVTGSTYAYGWFGVAPRRHFTFHWDYYNNRWMWR
jgi:hypothetical protein